MKVEGTKVPEMNKAKLGAHSQVHNGVISMVLLSNGSTMPCIPGSFKLYKTPDTGIPFVQFDVPGGFLDVGPMRVEGMPNSLTGVAYPMPTDEIPVVE